MKTKRRNNDNLIMRKGGPHGKSTKAKRIDDKRKIEKGVREMVNDVDFYRIRTDGTREDKIKIQTQLFDKGYVWGSNLTRQPQMLDYDAYMVWTEHNKIAACGLTAAGCKGEVVLTSDQIEQFIPARN